MNRRRTIVAAYLLDWIAGDPEWFPHPVRWIGKCSEQGERILRYPGQGAGSQLLAGGVLTLSMVAAVYLGTAKATTWTYRKSRGLGTALEILLAWTCLASRSLRDETSSVTDALQAEEMVLARHRLARIVGRDTDALDTSEICRAVIETAAESSSDGMIAPLFYMALGGVPLAMAYKTINTLDSMIGHADQQYFYFGKVAARLDDVANYLPARLTALGIVAAAAMVPHGDSKAALRVWLRDGWKHRSPNAGQPESAMAGALQVRLGGANSYNGEVLSASILGAEFPEPRVVHVRRAIQIVGAVSVLGIVATLLLQGKEK